MFSEVGCTSEFGKVDEDKADSAALFRVKIVDFRENEGITYRKMELTLLVSGQTKIVDHYQVTNWEDNTAN